MPKYRGSPYLTGKSKIRQINWGAKYLWDVRFPDCPAPFAEWFPAVDIDVDMWELNWKEFEVGMTTVSVPSGTGTLSLKMTFNDDVMNTIQNWLTQWVRSEILHNGQGLSSLAASAKKLQLAKLDFQRKSVSVQTFWVVPTGTMAWSGTSSADVNQNTCDFKIVGVADSTITSDKDVGFFSKYKITSGSFGGMINSIGSFIGVDLSGVASTVESTIDFAKDAYSTYQEVRETYDEINNTVHAVVADAKAVVDSFKNAHSLEGYFGAIEQGVNAWNNSMDNLDSASSTAIKSANSVTARAEARYKSMF